MSRELVITMVVPLGEREIAALRCELGPPRVGRVPAPTVREIGPLLEQALGLAVSVLVRQHEGHVARGD